MKTLEEKRQEAIEWLGQRWVYHPINRIKKLPEPLRINDSLQDAITSYPCDMRRSIFV